MNKTFNPMLYLCLIGSLMMPTAIAQSLVAEGVREFEELRLRQLQTVQNDGDIADFTTDGCSGGQSKNWALLADLMPGFNDQFGNKPPWESCCVAHDKRYWRGNTENGYLKRKQADIELMECVVNTGTRLAPRLSVKYSISEDRIRDAFKVTAGLMYQAVRFGGQPCSLLPWRWGYGWENCAITGTINNTE